MRELGDRAGQLDAGGAAADDREREELAPRAHVGLAFGALEREEHAPPDLEGVLEVLQARSVDLPVVVTEVRGLRADGEDQPVVRERLLRLVVDVDHTCFEVDVRDVSEHDTHVAVAGEDGADRGSDLSGRETGHRHLVEERLEEVIVRAVDQRDVDVGPRERLGGFEPAEAASDDDDAFCFGVHRSTCRGCGGNTPLRQSGFGAAGAAAGAAGGASFPFRHARIAVA